MITTSPRNPGKAVPLVEQPPKGAWDHYGLHNPSYIVGVIPNGEGHKSRWERIYFTGTRLKQSYIFNILFDSIFF